MGAPLYTAGNVEHPELSSIRSLLNAAKIVALIFWILGVLWILATIASAVVLSSVLGAPQSVWNLWYPVLFFVLNLVLWIQIHHVEELVSHGKYSAAKERTLIWWILGLVSGLVVGVILLIAYTKFDSVIAWQGAMGRPGGSPTFSPSTTPMWAPAPYSPPPSGSPPAGWPPIPAAPPVPVPPPPSAPAAAACPRCGRPATWVAQYNRWYCYGCQQYL